MRACSAALSVNTVLGEIRLPNGGHVDFWSVDHSQASRTWSQVSSGADRRKLPTTRAAWADSFPASAIAPALLDFNGSVVDGEARRTDLMAEKSVLPRHRPRPAWYGSPFFHAPTGANPYLSAEAIAASRAEDARRRSQARNWTLYFLTPAAHTIFPLRALLLETASRTPMTFPCQMVGLAIDTNSGKGGPDRDGCAAVVFALTMPVWREVSMGGRACFCWIGTPAWAQGGTGAVAPARAVKWPLAWFRRLKAARRTADGLSLSPRATVSAVIEAARAQGLHPREIDSKYVSAGKDARALMVWEPHATGGRVKIGRTALERPASYRGRRPIT